MNVDCDEKNEEGGIYSLFDKIDEINVKQKNCENEVSKNYFDNKNKLRRRGLSSFFLRIQLLLMMTLIPRPLTDEDENEVSKNFLGNKRSNVNLIESIKNNFCWGSNSKEGDSCSNSNCIPLFENWGYDNSEYNNDISNFGRLKIKVPTVVMVK